MFESIVYVPQEAAYDYWIVVNELELKLELLAHEFGLNHELEQAPEHASVPWPHGEEVPIRPLRLRELAA